MKSKLKENVDGMIRGKADLGSGWVLGRVRLVRIVRVGIVHIVGVREGANSVHSAHSVQSVHKFTKCTLQCTSVH